MLGKFLKLKRPNENMEDFVERLMGALDANRDGVLSFEELFSVVDTYKGIGFI